MAHAGSVWRAETQAKPASDLPSKRGSRKLHSFHRQNSHLRRWSIARPKNRARIETVYSRTLARSALRTAQPKKPRRMKPFTLIFSRRRKRNELERLKSEGRVSSLVYSGTIGEEAIRSETSEVRPGRGEKGEGRLPRLGEQPASAEAEDGQPEQTTSGIPAGLRAEQTDESRRLAKRFNRWVTALGRGTEQIRFREVGAASLPDALNRAI